MIQKKILCKDFEAAKSAVTQLSDTISQTKHKSGVITIYEKGFSKQEIDLLLGLAGGLDDLLVGTDSFGELACIELAVANAVEGIGVGGL